MGTEEVMKNEIGQWYQTKEKGCYIISGEKRKTSTTSIAFKTDSQPHMEKKSFCVSRPEQQSFQVTKKNMTSDDPQNSLRQENSKSSKMNRAVAEMSNTQFYTSDIKDDNTAKQIKKSGVSNRRNKDKIRTTANTQIEQTRLS